MPSAAGQAQPAQADYRLLDVVTTLVDVPNVSGRTVPAGTAGTIVEIFDPPWRGCMVEFPEDDELSLPILRPEQLAPRVPKAASA